jgi:hypothetical protein
MRAYIRKLQNKPKHIRKQILVGTLIVAMAFVSSVWIYGLGYRFSSQMKEKVASDVKPFALFGNSIGNAYQNIKASVGDISSLGKNNNQTDNKNLKQIDLIPVEYANQ